MSLGYLSTYKPHLQIKKQLLQPLNITFGTVKLMWSLTGEELFAMWPVIHIVLESILHRIFQEFTATLKEGTGIK